MNYSEEIIKAHTQWINAENKIPENEWENRYKARQSAARTKYRIFAALCKDAGLEPVKTAHEIRGVPKLTISLKR